MSRSALLAAIVLVAMAASGCEIVFAEPTPGSHRMLEQERAEPYAASPVFEDGKVMRTPPPHSVRHRVHLVDRVVRTGRLDDGSWVEEVPIPLDERALYAGQKHFEIICSTCHGRLGYADTPVARNMELRPPPSLHNARLRGISDGYLFDIVSEGYGLMPAFGYHLDERERWFVVAYVRALQKSQHLHLDELPEGERRHVLEQLADATETR